MEVGRIIYWAFGSRLDARSENVNPRERTRTCVSLCSRFSRSVRLNLLHSRHRRGARLDQFVPYWSSAVCLTCGNAVSTGVHQVRGAAGPRPRAPAIRLVYRRRRAADCRPLSVFPPVRGQVYGWSSPSDASTVQVNMSQCIHNVARWTCSNRQQLNSQKTEFIWCAAARRRHRIPSGDVQVGQDSVHPVQSARDLGVYVDGALTYHSRTVVMLQRTEINHAVSVFTRAKRSRHYR